VRRAWRVAAALFRFTKAAVPKRLLPLLAVCVAIPGPVDEVVLLVVVLAVVLRSGGRRAELRRVVGEAWQGTN